MPRSVKMPQKRNATLPAYHRLYVIISEGIKSGTYPPGELLPSENAIAETYEVSRVTVRRALEHLVEDGLVTKRKGQGSIVTLRDQHSHDQERVSGLLTNLVAKGAEFSVKTLFWDTVTPGAGVCIKLGVPVGTECWLIRRVRFIERKPLSYALIYLPKNVGASIPRRKAENKMVIQMLDDTDYRADEMKFSMSAALADGECAEVLQLSVGSAVLCMKGVAYSVSKEAVYYQESFYHTDRYEYAVQLNRDSSSGDLVWQHGKVT